MEKNELIAEIKKDLRQLKNQWVFKAYNYKGFEIKTKRFNNWFQIFKCDENNSLNIHFSMDMKQKDIISQIEKQIKEDL